MTKLDDAGLGELIAACNIVVNSGGSVVVAKISKAVEKTLARLMVSPFPTMGGGPFDSVNDAIRALRTGHDT